MAALGAALAITGCSSSPTSEGEVVTSNGAPTPGQDVFPVVASSEIIVGDNRLQIGLIDENDAPVRSPDTKLHVGFVGPGDEQSSSETTMEFLWTIRPVQGLWVGQASFDRSGVWQAVIEVEGGGYATAVRTPIEVKKKGTTPKIGERPPPVDTSTAADVDDLSEITTDSDPNPRFYELSIADALKDGKPAVIIFATPKFCTSQVCGPTLSIVKGVARKFPGFRYPWGPADRAP